METNRVTAINSNIAEVYFHQDPPEMHDILLAGEDQSILLEVVSAEDPHTFNCYILSNAAKLKRGDKVKNSRSSLAVPVGEAVLGRALNVFGQPQDGQPFKAKKHRSVLKSSAPSATKAVVPEKILQTGIKAIDFFAPLLESGKAGIIGGAGLGKTMILTELINNIVLNQESSTSSNKDKVSVFSAVGERSREADELLRDVTEAGVLDKTVMMVGQMGENPAVRFRTAAAAATIAEEFRDQATDVLFFMDNMYRFSQAGYELATQVSAIPSEDGYQPTIPSEIGQLHERLVSSHEASITTIEAVYLPSDDLTDYSVRTVLSYLDSYVTLSRDVYQSGRLPAIDLLNSHSSALAPEIVGEKHYQLYLQTKKLLEQANKLERIVSLVGLSELSAENQQLYKRSELLKNYMTQSFTVAENQSNREGVRVPLDQALTDVEKILAGKVDEVDPDELLFVEKIF